MLGIMVLATPSSSNIIIIPNLSTIGIAWSCKRQTSVPCRWRLARPGRAAGVLAAPNATQACCVGHQCSIYHSTHCLTWNSAKGFNRASYSFM